MEKRYSVLIVDDERLAREEVKRALRAFPEFTILGEASNSKEAKDLVESAKVDVMFLDINMPEKSGIELLEELAVVPEVVFTTAYDQYAVKAFELNALDYLVKPLRKERFDKAMRKVLKALVEKRDVQLPIMVHRKVFVKDRGTYHLIEVADIWLIESLENYARIYFGTETVILKRSLIQLEEKLSALPFFRINRGQIINTNYIEKVDSNYGNKLGLILKTGLQLKVSVRRSIALKKAMGL